MSTLYLVRHGQASFGEANYDKLSGLGERQLNMLAHYWLNFGVRIDAAYTGTLDRQRRSAECVREVFAGAGKTFPEPVVMPEFNEYETRHILTGSLSTVLTQNPEIARLAKELAPDGLPNLVKDKKAFQRIFSRVMDMWVDEKLNLPGMETWKGFTCRVLAGLSRMMTDQGAGKNVAVFTSGGPISAAMQKALGTSDKTALELGWVIANGSVSEFRWSGDKFSLVTFNTTPHLAEQSLVSYR